MPYLKDPKEPGSSTVGIQIRDNRDPGGLARALGSMKLWSYAGKGVSILIAQSIFDRNSSNGSRNRVYNVFQLEAVPKSIQLVNSPYHVNFQLLLTHHVYLIQVILWPARDDRAISWNLRGTHEYFPYRNVASPRLLSCPLTRIFASCLLGVAKV